jgi:hypothetical protein
VGTIVAHSGGRLLATVTPDPRTGLAVVDLPPSGHGIAVSFGGNGLLRPSAAHVRLH